MSKPSARRAFTLLELLITLVLLAGVLAITWPRVSRMLKKTLPREAALQLKSDLADAREMAILNGEPIAIRARPESGEYELIPVDEIRPDAGVQMLGGGASPGAAPGSSAQNRSEARSSGLRSRGAGSLGAGQTGVTLSNDMSLLETAQADPTSRTTLELPAGIRFVTSPPATAIVTDAGAPGSGLAGTAPARGGNPASVANNPLAEAQQVAAELDNAASNSTDMMQIGATGNGDAVESADDWQILCVFQADGRTSDKSIRLRDAVSGSAITLELRGLTGSTNVGPVEVQTAPRWNTTDPNDPLTDAALMPNSRDKRAATINNAQSESAGQTLPAAP